MATDPIERANALAVRFLARHREWAPWEPVAPQMRELPAAGLSNHSFLLTGTERYVLRVATAARAGVDRHRECAFARAAAASNIGAPVLLCDPSAGVLITRHVGEALAGVPDAAELTHLLRAIHSLAVDCDASLPSTSRSTLQSTLQSVEQLATYRACLNKDSPTRQLLTSHATTLERATAQVAGASAPVMNCHNDLLPANLRRLDGRLIAIDWEYAAPGDPFFELAVCTSVMTDQHSRDELLARYLQRPPRAAEYARFNAQQLIYAAIESCWHEIYGDSDAVTNGQACQRLAIRLRESQDLSL